MGAQSTDAKIAAVQVVAWRRLGAAGRITVAAEMSADTRRIAEEKLRRSHPDLASVRPRSPSVSLEDALARLIGVLEATNVPFMLTGSLASAAHGVPRATADLDLVVDPDPSSVDDLLAALEAGGWRVQGGANAARETIAERSHVVVVDETTSWKVDLVVRKERPFSITEFARRERLDVLGLAAWVATAEDTIVSKLEWAKQTRDQLRRSQQRRDIVGVVASRGDDLDRTYVDRWVEALGLADEWRLACAAQ